MARKGEWIARTQSDVEEGDVDGTDASSLAGVTQPEVPVSISRVEPRSGGGNGG
jgi:hypothetical protein